MKCSICPFFCRMIVGMLLVQPAAVAGAADFFLTLGGGYDATGNQLSLERNVQRFQQVLSELRPDGPVHDVYFADGDDRARDLQFLDESVAADCPPARRIMTELFGDRDSVGLSYRNHAVADVAGATSAAAIEGRLRKLAEEIASGDRLFIYATGHGGAASGGYDDFEENYEDYYGDDYSEHYQRWADAEESANQFDTTYYLWNLETVAASELAAWLDRLPNDVTVTLVMVQCYSGGFSHAIFHQADETLGLAPQQRCGFFSQVHDRPAAGCTPDAEKAGFDEYSGYFWSALAGKSPSDQRPVDADYDHSGTVSFAEAHAYAVIESETVDIPVRSTGALLRRYSKLGKRPSNGDDDDASSGGLFGIFSKSNEKSPPEAELMRPTGSLREIASRGRPDQRAILERLPERIGLSPDDSVEEVRERLEQADDELNQARRKYAVAAAAYSKVHEQLVERVREIWPELNEDFAPIFAELCSERSDEFTERVEALPGFEAMQTARALQDEASDAMLEAMHLEAGLQRLLRTVENIVLAENLAKTAPANIVERYEQMVAAEESGLAASELP